MSTRPGGIKCSIFSMLRRENRKKHWGSTLRHGKWVDDMAEQIRKEVDDRIVNALVKYETSVTSKQVFE